MRKRWMIGRQGSRWTAALLTVILCCTGCGQKQNADVPKLIEPVSVNAAYRPVEYGSVGKVEVLPATVVPEEYGHYYKANVLISDILVEVGDTVAAGDVLAYADVETAKEALNDYQRQLAYENATYALQQEISRISREKMAYLKAQQTAVQQDAEDIRSDGTETSEVEARDISTDTEDYDKQIAVEQENAYYDSLLHEYRVAALQESIADMQEIVADGTLTARHGGQVTYTKNIAKGLTAGANENIVIVSDLTDMHIELTDTGIQEFRFRKYDVQYIMVDGEKVPVTEAEYSSEEKVLAEVNDSYPNVRFACPPGYTWTLGAMYPVYFMKEDMQDVLVVGNDSLYTEGEDQYVYVRNESGEQEKRYIETGVSDDSYTQVKEGLSEGEQVYYHSTVRMPSDYSEYTVELSDFELTKCANKYKMSEANVFPYLSSCEGEITEVAVEKGAEVSEGDLLYIIDTGEGKAAMTEAQRSIDMENLFYQESITSLDEQIAETNAMAQTDGSMSYEVLILNIQKELAERSHENSLYELQKNYDKISSGNDGTGKVSVYAPVSGKVSQVDIVAGDSVEAGNQMLQITTKSTDIIQVQMEQTDAIVADVGETVTISRDAEYWEGICIGFGAGPHNAGKGYVYTDDSGEVHLSYNGGESDCAMFYIRMKDAAFLEGQTEGDGKKLVFTSISMHNVVVLPSSLIYTEADPMIANKVYHYVWRLVDGELIKQYVLVDDSLRTSDKQVVLSGVAPGDVVVQE